MVSDRPEYERRHVVQDAVKLFCIYARVRNVSHLARLMGMDVSGRVYRWESKDGGAGLSSLTIARMIRLVLLQMSGRAQIEEINEIVWDAGYVEWTDWRIDPILQYESGHIVDEYGTRIPTFKSHGWGVKGDNPFPDACRRFTSALGESHVSITGFGQMLGVPRHSGLALGWYQGGRALGPKFSLRLLLCLLWHGLGMVDLRAVEEVDWERGHIVPRGGGRSIASNPFRASVHEQVRTLYQMDAAALEFSTTPHAELSPPSKPKHQIKRLPRKPILDRDFCRPLIEQPRRIVPRG